MGKPKAPKSPDPRLVAQTQADANIKTAQASTELNRYNERNPLGSQSWTQDPTNPNKYTLETQYDPRLLAGLNNQLDMLSGRTGAASNLNSGINTMVGDLGNLYHNATGVLGKPMPTADETTRTNISNAIYDRYRSRLDPKFQQAGSDLESRLAAQGITQGSSAYNREQDNLMRDRNDAYSMAMSDADSRSTRDMLDINQNNWMGRNAALGELSGGLGLVGQNMELANALSSVPNVQASLPQFSQGAGGAAQIGQTPFAESVYNSYSGDMNRYGQKMGTYNNMLSGIAGLGSAALLA